MKVFTNRIIKPSFNKINFYYASVKFMNMKDLEKGDKQAEFEKALAKKKKLDRTPEKFDSVKRYSVPKLKQHQKKSLEKAKKYIKKIDEERENNYLKLKEAFESKVNKLALGDTIFIKDNQIINQKDEYYKYININLRREPTNEYKEVLFSPLNQAEVDLTNQLFTKFQAEFIFKGGRAVLKHELNELINRHNQSKTKEEKDVELGNKAEDKSKVNEKDKEKQVKISASEKLSKLISSEECKEVVNRLSQYEELSNEDVEFLNSNFPNLFLNNNNSRNLIIHTGKSMVNSLKNLLTEKEKVKNNIKSNLNAMDSIINISSSNLNKNDGRTIKKLIPEHIVDVLKRLKIDEKTITQDITKAFSSKFKINKLEKVSLEIQNIGIIKGLSMEKYNNLTPDCYVNKNSLEDSSIRTFIIKDGLESNGHFINYAQRDMDKYKLIIRTTVKITSNKQEYFGLLDNELIIPVNYVHLSEAVFPELFNYYKYSPNNWKLVDVNNSTNPSLLPNYSSSSLLNLSNFWMTYYDANIVNLYNSWLNNVSYTGNPQVQEKANSSTSSQEKDLKSTEDEAQQQTAPELIEKEKEKEDDKDKSKKGKKKEAKDAANKELKDAANKKSAKESVKVSKEPALPSKVLNFNYKVKFVPTKNIHRFDLENSRFPEKKAELMSKLNTIAIEKNLAHNAVVTSNIIGKNYSEVISIMNQYKSKLNELKFNMNEQEVSAIIKSIQDIFFKINPFKLKNHDLSSASLVSFLIY